jgi:hypothetical protein
MFYSNFIRLNKLISQAAFIARQANTFDRKFCLLNTDLLKNKYTEGIYASKR